MLAGYREIITAPLRDIGKFRAANESLPSDGRSIPGPARREIFVIGMVRKILVPHRHLPLV